MAELVDRLETDAHTVVCSESLGLIEPWHIGADMAFLFAGKPVVERSLGRAGGKFVRPQVQRYYHAPRLPLGVISDGTHTSINVDSQRTDIIAVIQAYGDYMRQEEPYTMAVQFTIPAEELNGTMRGDGWIFSAKMGEKKVAHGRLVVTAPLYVDRLTLAAQGLSYIAGKHIPDGGFAIVEKHLTPRDLDTMAVVWEEAMNEPTSRRAAQLVLERCTDIRIRLPS